MDAEDAQKRWILENDVAEAGPSELDALYKWDPEEQRRIQYERPWTKDPNYFKR